MFVWRLVNSGYDPVTLGSFLTRLSDYSNQKLGKGLYFCPTKEATLQFLATHHDHTYTHLLKCELLDLEEDSFFNIVALGYTPLRKAPYRDLKFPASAQRYCRDKNLKGIIWQATGGGWTELVLFAEYLDANVRIVEAEPLESVSEPIDEQTSE